MLISARHALAIFLIFKVLGLSAQDSKITLEKIWKEGTFSSKTVSGINSMQDGIHYTSTVKIDDAQYLLKYDYATGVVTDTVVNGRKLKGFDGKSFEFSDYEFNTDESKLLLATEQESIYRRSSKANYYALDLQSKVLTAITDFDKGKQQLAAFSPTSNQVAFVRNNNIFISDLESGIETQATTDGAMTTIINGALDWVYEEEFSFDRGFYWSPEGSKIAYYKFDESEVPLFDLTYYESLYPRHYNYKYPKAGETNSTVRVFSFDLATASNTEIEVNADADQYIPRIKWTKSDDQLCIMRMNRHQNKLEFLLAQIPDLPKGKIEPTTIYSETAETYIDVSDNLIFLEDGKHFIISSEKDGWNHIYIHGMDGREVGQVTKGKWEVIDFYGVDQIRQRIFFSAAIANTIGQDIYSAAYEKVIKGSGNKGKNFIPKGETRGMLKSLTNNGHTNNAYFSESFAYFINFESSAAKPNDIALFNAEGQKVRDIENNSKLSQTISTLEIAPKKFGTFKTDGGTELNYWMIKPSDFDSTKKYPAIFMIYGGPGSNTVTDGWGGSNYFWHQMLAQQGYIVISVDPRGTMRKGRDFKHSTYLNLGKLEIEDFMASARHFGALPYIEQARIGMMGWSYGGYMTSLAMTKGAEYFKMGIAVAPVTNWRYYDSIYTERFLRTPQENPEGYDQNSPINFTDQLKGKYLLIHGDADDNVHVQNTMEMVESMVKSDKQFDLFIYPDKNHGIYGGNTRYHLYTKMTRFIKENL